MSRYPEGEALLAKCRAGLGKLVIVEGETDDDDPWFYGRWFGNLARELTFIPQNGHEKVVQAVRDLRERLAPTHEVYGIRDRDFSEEWATPVQADWVTHTMAETIPEDGVMFTRWYTLENYLLVAAGWLRVIMAMHRRVPAGWDSEAAVQEQIDAAYHACLPLAAWNHTVRTERRRLPRDGQRYVEHPQALPRDPQQELGAWEQGRGVPRPLAQCFEEQFSFLRAMSPEELPCWVTGKAVLKVLLERFPVAIGPRPHPESLVNLYMREYPTPPDEHMALVRRILAR